MLTNKKYGLIIKSTKRKREKEKAGEKAAGRKGQKI